MEKLVPRPTYVEHLLKWRDRDVIKVVTGVRRCGKSTVLELFRNELLRSGVAPDRIVALDFEDPDTPDFASWREVWNWIRPRIGKGRTTYVFLDEVQRVPEFEKLVDGLHARRGIDVYVTGSNAYMLSGELATHLSGRYVEIPMQPLSFREWCDAAGATGDWARRYAEYLYSA